MQKVTNDDRRFMALALTEALKGRGRVHPNPLVGAVLVKNGRLVGKGAHLAFGGPHAEASAIKSARGKAAGASLYVTLEPCDHTGKTPPCSSLIIRHKIREVITAAYDPNPLVSGRGLERLKKAGVRVREGVLEHEADAMNKEYDHWMRTKMPYVTVKIAQSSDGYIAGPRKRPRWITGAASRKMGHELRAVCDAVIAGVGTVLADNPLLTARFPRIKRERQPLRVIVDSRLRTPAEARVLSSSGPNAPVCLATTRLAPAERSRALSKKAQILIVKDRNGKVDLKELLKELGRRGIVHVLIEGGAELWKDAFARGLVNECYRFVSPKTLGGGVQVPPGTPVPLWPRRVRVGGDTLIHGRVR